MAKVKNFFIKIGRWFKTHAPTKRRLIQIYSALLFNANIKGYFAKGVNVVYRGGTKNFCMPGLNCYSCPGAVTACPLGALQNALGASGTRAPYYVIGILGLLCLTLARTICGFLCPTGLGQELLYKIKTPKVKKSRVTRVLSYFKYVLLAVFVIAIPLIYSTVPGFCKYICPSGTMASVLQLANGNSTFYSGLGFLFSWKFALLIVFIVLSIFIYRFFCRFICPLGAILGFFNKISFLGVKLEEQKCVECGLCLQTCPMDIRKVGDHECINCGACVPVCPTKAISWKGSKIFLHGNAVKAEEKPQQEEAPKLSALLANGSVQSSVSVPAEKVPQLNVTVVNSDLQEQSAEIASKEHDDSVSTAENEIAEIELAEKRLKKRGFWLQFSAWALALAVLVTALVYFNFLAPDNTLPVYKVGETVPDFVLQTYVSDGVKENGEVKYTSVSSNVSNESTFSFKGKVTVLNYWATWCGPCVEELPWFERIRKEFGGQINVVAIHQARTAVTTNVQKFIDEPNRDKPDSWSDWGIIFAKDSLDAETYTMLGGDSGFPMTVILDADGVITCVIPDKVEESELRNQITAALNK